MKGIKTMTLVFTLLMSQTCFVTAMDTENQTQVKQESGKDSSWSDKASEVYNYTAKKAVVGYGLAKDGCNYMAKKAVVGCGLAKDGYNYIAKKAVEGYNWSTENPKIVTAAAAGFGLSSLMTCSYVLCKKLFAGGTVKITK